VQADQHLHLLPLVRDYAEIRVVSKRFEDAQALARHHPAIVPMSDLEAAVRSSDVVCLATHSTEPVIDAGWVRPGTHVSSVGVAPPGGELPVALLRRASLFVETRDAFASTPVGSCELAGLDPDSGTPLGDMLLGRRPGRVSEDQITVYKAMGTAMEDMVVADLAWRHARRLGKGRMIAL
jgi:ornithine cyclodeaminase/alanine dehydrogenase-like protein (mu-crystallin family)